jgi:hypothetical protein
VGFFGWGFLGGFFIANPAFLKVHNNWESWGEEEEEVGEWGGQSSGGKITVLRAGPGYHEQKEYDIGPDGQITEVTSTAAPLSIMENDACKGKLSTVDLLVQ